MHKLGFLLSLVLLPAQSLYFGSRYQVQFSNVPLEALDAPVTADFNRDGVLDIAIPSQGLVLLMGKGGGEFQPPRRLVETLCFSVAASDFDGDGNPDLALADSGRGGVLLLRGDGAGGFSAPIFFPAPANPYRIVVADLNLDSSPDVLLTDRNTGNVTVLLNRGDGQFGGPISSPAGIDPTFLVTGDFNGDSIPDAVTVNFEPHHASLLAGTGDGHFLPPVTIAEGTSAYNVTAADFNGDGRLDLAFGTMHEYIHVLLAAEGGGFASGDWYYFGRFAHLTAADVNHDGNIDLFGVLRDGTAAILVKGLGEGRFAEPQTVATFSFPSYVSLADLNGDQLLDAVVTSNLGAVFALLNTGNGPSWRITHTVGPARFRAVAGADFDGDRKPDLAVATNGVSGVWVMRGFGDGTLGEPVRYDAGAGPTAMAIADFNRDGKPDIATANFDSRDVALQLNQGDGTFLPARFTPLGDCASTTIAAADFDKDGFLDIAVGCPQAAALLILPGRGDGTFRPPVRLALSGFVNSFAVSDFNSDAIPDVAVLGEGLGLYFGNGDGSFRGPVSLPAAVGCFDLLAADWNKDSAADLAVACPGNRVILIFVNSGTGAFRRLEFATQPSPGRLAAGDLTGDGHPDLAMFQEPQTVAIYAGNGDGTFSPAADLGVSGGVGAVAVADFNGDGRADLVAPEAATSRILLFLSSAEVNPLQPPAPLSPAGNALILQNDPTSGCPFDSIRGSGFRLVLRWTPMPSAAALVAAVDRPGLPVPLMFSNTTESTGTTFQICTWVPDTELEGWSWRVRSRDVIGNLSPWSEPAQFRLSPCRLADGRPCGAAPPPIPPPSGQISMSVARTSHTATLLRNGRVLLTGGISPQGPGVFTLQTAELYDPATRTFVPAGRMQTARAYHTATLLPDGKVLLAGGMSVAGSQSPVPVAALEIYDPDQGTFSAAGSMIARNAHTATLLADGRVLLAGGIPGQGAHLNAAEVFDPATGRVTAVGLMVAGRAFHTATLLRDGRVLMIGGGGANPEFFVPSSNSFVPSPTAVIRMSHAATLLPDGRVLLTGGASAQGPEPAPPEIFDPANGSLTATGAMTVPRADHSATALGDGRVLILGGRSTTGESIAAGEIYTPGTRAFTPGPALAAPRVQHTATLLPDGSVLVAGGFRIQTGAQTWLGTAEVVGPIPAGN